MGNAMAFIEEKIRLAAEKKAEAEKAAKKKTRKKRTKK